MTFVVGASMTLAWHFPDERTEFTASVLRRLRHDSAPAPGLWPTEVANGLLVAERRGRITPAEAVVAVERTLGLPIEIGEISATDTLGTVAQIARQHRLTVCDATYLHVAMREGLPIAGIDEDLVAAAKRVGLPDLE